jgi:hypothetical protein
MLGIASPDDHTIELVEFFFADGSREAFAHLSRYDVPAVMLVSFDGLVEAIDLQ